MPDDFSKFMEERKARQHEAPPFDSAARRRQWLADVEDLYRLILDEALGRYISDGQICSGRAPIELTEPRLGSYDVDRLTLWIGEDQLTAEPAGTMLIACRGRVDVTAPPRLGTTCPPGQGRSRRALHGFQWRTTARDLHPVDGPWRGL